MNLKELELDQLQGIYNDANATRHILSSMNINADNCYILMSKVDVEGSKRFGDYWLSK
jgi:hypothetical protein